MIAMREERESLCSSRPHTQHTPHAVHLPLGALLMIWRTPCVFHSCSSLECPRHPGEKSVGQYHLTYWPDSLASRYMRATSDESNYKVLAR